jgi:hypothetical protein
MTSEARERSWADGKPIHMFRFTRGDVSWYYTSADRDQEYLDETWTAAAIKRDTSIRQGSDSAQLSIKVSMPSSLAVAENWRPYPASEAIVLTIFVRHAGESDAMAEWVGRVVGPKFDGALLTLTGEPSRTRAKRAGNSPKWQRGCGSVLYGKGVGKCNLEPEIVPVPATVTAVAELTFGVTAAGFASAPRSLAGGVLEWIEIEEPDPEDPEAEPIEHQRTRPIAAHTWPATTITLGAGDHMPAIGDAVTAYTRPLYVEATVTALAGLTLTAAAFASQPSGRLAGGFVRWARAADGLIEYRTIKAHSGSTIQLDYGALDLAVGLELRAYPGCAHNWADCGYHQNRHQYGGDLWMPVKNPFDGNPVW